MDTDHAVDPAGRRIQRGGGHDGLGELARVDLKPAMLFRLEQPDAADLLHRLDRGVGQLADPLGLDGLFA